MDRGNSARQLMDMEASAQGLRGSEQAGAKISLLPTELIELCDVVGCSWKSLPLPQILVVGSQRISLPALTLTQVRDLGAASPLAVLTLAQARQPLQDQANGIWPQALASMPAIVAPILEAAMTLPLTQLFKLPSAAHDAETPPQSEPQQREQHPDSSNSALFFEPREVIETLWHAWPLYQDELIKVPEVPCPARPGGSLPGQEALLSPAIQRAMAAKGCDFSAKLDALTLNARTYNCCIRHGGVRTLRDLVSKTPEQLFEYRNFGPKSYLDVVAALRTYLAPWLAQLPATLLVGSEDSSEPIASEQPPAPMTDDSLHPTNPFVALRNADLVAALDLYGIPWRDVSIGSLTSAPVEPPLVDSPVGALVDECADTTVIAAHLSPEQASCILDEIGEGLTRLLIRWVARPDAFRTLYERAAFILNGVTVTDLLAELMEEPDGAKARALHNGVEVLYARKGLYDGRPQTLDMVGQRLGVSRERIRQLEKRAWERLEKPELQPQTQAVGALVASAVRALGGAATLPDVAAQVGDWIPFGAIHPVATTRFLAQCCPDLTVTKDDLLIALPKTEAIVRQVQEMLHELVREHPDITRRDLIAQTAAAWYGQGMALDERFVAAVLATTPKIAAQDARYQLTGRGGKTQRIIHAMRSLGQPAKVVEIGAEYRRLYPDDSQCGDQSIRGFFDRFHDRFVVVGMSTYALVEWGYEPHINNIAALVEHLLAESDCPLEREEVVERALARYYWKAQSIRAQLDTNERVQKFGAGYYGLRGRDYGDFVAGGVSDAADVDDESQRDRKTWRERLVVGSFTNRRGHQVARIQLSARCLDGYLPLTSRPLRAIFPDIGVFRAEVWPAVGERKYLAISRAGNDISGLRPFFDAAHARAGDALFIERLASATSDAPALYRFALAPADDLAGAMEAVGLTSDTNGATTSDIPILHSMRKPQRLIQMVEYAAEHPWMPPGDAGVALNCAPRNPVAQEYLRLAQVTGLVATGQPHADGPTVIRPTALGRAWAFAAGSAGARGGALALSLPAYRAHLRALGGVSRTGEQGDAEAQRLGDMVLTAWDRLCGMTSGASAVRALETSTAILSTDLLTGPSLPLALLLLMAQTQGRGLSLAALGDALSGQARAALQRLRALGLAIAEEDGDRVALAERAQLAVASPSRVAAMLQASVGDERIATDMAQAWVNALRAVAHRRTLRASDLYDELHTLAPDFLYTTLARAPAATPEYALDADMELPFCGFPMLVGDWALAPLDSDWPHAGTFWTVISNSTCNGDASATPIGVALCDDLLNQPWDVQRHLAGNAHLALLTVIAADEERLAERLSRSEDGWRLAGGGLITTLDALLSALGYDVWNERYRNDPGQQTRLGDTLVALAERLHLIEATGGRLEAVSGPATRMYYEACDRGFIERLTTVLVTSLATSLPLA